jgi:hypothetical protein
MRFEGVKIRYIDEWGNNKGPDLVFDDTHCIFSSGCGIVEVKSLRLDVDSQAKLRQKASSSLKEALSDLHWYLDMGPFKLRNIDQFVPDFGLAVSQIFDISKGNIIRTMVVSIRNADGSYTDRNWRPNS